MTTYLAGEVPLALASASDQGFEGMWVHGIGEYALAQATSIILLTRPNAGRRVNRKSEVAMTQEQLFTQLQELTKRWNDYEDVPRSQQAECRKIGEKIHALGGEALMRDAYYDAKAHNRFCTVVQAYWDGIGDWRW